MNKVEHDFDDYLPMIEQAQQLDDLPVIHVALRCPKYTFRFLFCLIFSIFWVCNTLYLLLMYFDWAILIFVCMSFLPIALTMYEYQKMNLRLFHPKREDIYYCELTPKHFKWVFNEQVKEILWHNFMIVDKFMTTQQEPARIEIYPTDSQLGKNDIILYDTHLPCSYRTLYKIIVEYREKRRQLVLSSILTS